MPRLLEAGTYMRAELQFSQSSTFMDLKPVGGYQDAQF